MAVEWSLQSSELSPWLSGIINQEYGPMKFVYVFRYEISGTLYNDRITNVGDIVAVKLKKKISRSPNIKSQFEVKQVELARREDSIREIRCERRNVFIQAHVAPTIIINRLQLFDHYLGNAYDLEGHLPRHAIQSGKPLLVDLLVKGDHQDMHRSFLEVVKYYGFAEERTQDSQSVQSAVGLVYRDDSAYHFVWSRYYDRELRVRKNLCSSLQLGSWISFIGDSIDDSYEIVGGDMRLEKEQLPTSVSQGVAMILASCVPKRVEGGIQILDSEEAGTIADSFGLLRDFKFTFPQKFWLEPCSSSRYLWKISPSNEAFKLRNIDQVSPSHVSLTGKLEVGCIVTVENGICFIWSKAYPRDVIAGTEFIANIENPLGVWVSFPTPARSSDKFRTRGPIKQLEMGVTKTRIRYNVPELEVTLSSVRGRESDGSLIFYSDEVGDVVDVYFILDKDVQFPKTVWVVKQNKTDYKSVWKISFENSSSNNKTSPKSDPTTLYNGIVVREAVDVHWIFCSSFSENIAAHKTIWNEKDLLGRWVEFGEPYSSNGCLELRGPVRFLNELGKKRVIHNQVELFVKCESLENPASDGSIVFVSREVGRVLDLDDFLRGTTVDLPFFCWVTHQSYNSTQSRWKVSRNNDLSDILEKPSNLTIRNEEDYSTPRATPASEKYQNSRENVNTSMSNMRSTSARTQRFSHQRAPRNEFYFEEASSQSAVAIPQLVPSCSTPNSAIALNGISDPHGLTESMGAPSQQQSLLSLCSTVLENRELCLLLQKFDNKLYEAFINAVFLGDD